MHSWLPDAHSQAPAPVSGLMSGVLLSVAFYAILRVQAVVDPVLGPGLMRGLLLTAGLLSLAVAAGLIIAQRDLKRMLAYSSIEHMGLLALAAAIGGTLAIAAALLHVLGHGLAKSSLFVVSGRILAVEGTTQIAGIRGLLTRRPAVAVPYLVGMAALLGLPPFSLFFSEVAIVVAGFQGGLGWAMAVAVGLLLVLFAGLARHSASMMLGQGSATPADLTATRPDTTRTAASAALRPGSHRGHRLHHRPPVHLADPGRLAAGGCPVTERPNTQVLDVDRHDVAATLERASGRRVPRRHGRRRRGRRLPPGRLRSRPTRGRPTRGAGARGRQGPAQHPQPRRRQLPRRALRA